MSDYIHQQIEQNYYQNFQNDANINSQIKNFLSDNNQSSIFIYKSFTEGNNLINFTNNINQVPNLNNSANNSALCFIKSKNSSAADFQATSNIDRDNLICLPVSNESIKLSINNIYSPLYPELGGVFSGLRLELKNATFAPNQFVK